MIELFFIERFPHPDRYSCETGRSFGDPFLNIYLFNWYVALGGRGGHKNSYEGWGKTSQGRIISIKFHFASLIFGITSPLVLVKFYFSSYGPKCCIFIQLIRLTGFLYIQKYIYHTNTNSQYAITKDMHKFTNYLSVKIFQNFCLSPVCCKVSQKSFHFSIQLPFQFR